MVLISIVIPVLNEESVLASTLGRLQPLRKKGVEVIVVDGGSNDATCSIAKLLADVVINCERGRANQLNKGAKAAQGQLLLFLHADTQLPSNAFELLGSYASEVLCWGRFRVRLDGQSWVYRLIEILMNSRSCLTGIVTGDHAMFVSSQLFEQVGGYPNIALMEDVAISKRLKKMSSLCCLNSVVVTSSRRWQQNGVVWTIVLMWRLRLLYFFKQTPEKLAQKYHDARLK